MLRPIVAVSLALSPKERSASLMRACPGLGRKRGQQRGEGIYVRTCAEHLTGHGGSFISLVLHMAIEL